MERYQNIRKELEEKKQKILSRLGKVTRHLRQEEGPLSADFQEQATELENAEVLQALESSARKDFEEITHALMRIEAGTYNICALCEDEIAEGRLHALPYTRLCIDCANKAEKR